MGKGDNGKPEKHQKAGREVKMAQKK